MPRSLEKEQAGGFTTEFKSSDLSSAEVAANPIYANSILSFKQGFKTIVVIWVGVGIVAQ